MSEQIAVTKASTRFEIRVDGELAGFVEYSDADGVRSMPHTLIDDAFRGRGLAGTLIKQALDVTRDEGLALLPICPAVKRFVAKHPEYADLVPADRRAEFDL